MPICQDCNCEISIEKKILNVGETIVCHACGAEYEIISTNPIELELIEEEK